MKNFTASWLNFTGTWLHVPFHVRRPWSTMWQNKGFSWNFTFVFEQYWNRKVLSKCTAFYTFLSTGNLFLFFFTILSNKHYHYYWLSLGFWKSCIFVKVFLLQTINLLIQCLSSYLYYPFLIASILPSNWNGGNSKVFLKNTVFVHVLFLVLLFFVKSIAMPVWKRRKRRRKILKVAVKLPFPPSKRCQQFLKSTAWKIYHQISQYRKETKPPPLINLHA